MSRRTALGKVFRSRRADATHRTGLTSPGTIRVYVSSYTGQAIRDGAQIRTNATARLRAGGFCVYSTRPKSLTTLAKDQLDSPASRRSVTAA
jgi:hypothetical protein